MVFTESPLVWRESVHGGEEVGKRDVEESFSHLGDDGGEVNAAVKVRVVGGGSFEKGVNPVDAPRVGPGVCGENEACKEGDGEG